MDCNVKTMQNYCQKQQIASKVISGGLNGTILRKKQKDVKERTERKPVLPRFFMGPKANRKAGVHCDIVMKKRVTKKSLRSF